jgi:hypothetical protein
MEMSMENKICVWPDYTWCRHEYLEQYSWKSGDYMVLDVPEEMTAEGIDFWLLCTRPQGGVKDQDSRRKDSPLVPASDTPPEDEAVWMVCLDGRHQPMIGCWSCIGDQEFGWCNSYGRVWVKDGKWKCDAEFDDDYTPDFWMRLPDFNALMVENAFRSGFEERQRPISSLGDLRVV